MRGAGAAPARRKEEVDSTRPDRVLHPPHLGRRVLEGRIAKILSNIL